jgi:hypothetical protein
MVLRYEHDEHYLTKLVSAVLRTILKRKMFAAADGVAGVASVLLLAKDERQF